VLLRAPPKRDERSFGTEQRTKRPALRYAGWLAPSVAAEAERKREDAYEQCDQLDESAEG
jgi:hypothetical protein